MTLREKITSLIKSYLQSISVSNGYLTNAGSNVKVWGTQVVPNEKTFYINIKDVKFEHRNNYGDVITYEIETTYSSSNAYSMICNICDDIERALFVNQDNLSNAINDTSVRIFADELGEIEVIREHDKERAYAKMIFTVQCNHFDKWKLKNNNY